MASKQTQRREAAKGRDALEFRTFSVRAESMKIEERSVDAVIATESPVPMPDFERYEMVPEVLRADGVILPAQVPLLNSHARKTMSDQLGSARELRREGDKIVGRLFFASTAEAQDAFRLVQDGHATDVSAGYQVIEKTFVPRGKTATVAGRDYTGPVNVVTKWKVREVSQTPIGADEQAKLRGLELTEFPNEKGFTMNEQLRALLESRGMPKDLDDTAAQEWAVKNSLGDRKEPDNKPAEITQEFITRTVEEATRKAIEHAEKQRTELRGIGDTLLKIANITRTAAVNEALDACRSREDIEKAILKLQEERSNAELSTAPVVVAGPAQRDKFENGMRTALILRSMDYVPLPAQVPGEPDDANTKRRTAAVESVFPVAQQAKDHTIFRNASLYDMAKAYVEQVHGVRTLELTRQDVAAIALFGPERADSVLGLGLRNAAYHTTGSFAEITRNAMNKSMMLGYTEAPSTWDKVMRRGASVADFKRIDRLRMGAVPNLPVWGDNKDPEKASLADAREYYAVECRSLEIDFSYQLLVNDDMDVLSRIPGQMGQAARRTVNAVAWGQITSNPTMSDGKALFLETAAGNRKRSNLTTGSATPTTATLQTMTNKMMQMRGENTPEQAESADILSLMPRFIAGPGALRTTILQLVRSVYDPADAYQKFNTASDLIPIIEPLLDVASTTAWYLFADPGQIDTVEVSFLQGQETPQVRQVMDERKLSQSWIILQTFGAKAMNHRGMQKHDGA